MIKKSIFSVGAVLLCGICAVWSLQPISVTKLGKMSQEQRLTYLRNLETSDVVGYYCGNNALSIEIEYDIEISLRKDHGVSECSFNGKTRHVPEAG